MKNDTFKVSVILLLVFILLSVIISTVVVRNRLLHLDHRIFEMSCGETTVEKPNEFEEVCQQILEYQEREFSLELAKKLGITKTFRWDGGSVTLYPAPGGIGM